MRTTHDLLWCTFPILENPRSWTLLPKYSAVTAHLPLAGKRPRLGFFSRSMMLATTENQFRMLEGLVSPGETAQNELPLFPRFYRYPSKWLRAATSVYRLGETILRSRGQSTALPVWRRTVYKTAHYLQLFKQFRLEEFGSIVVSSQHDPIVRALLLVAHAQNTPSVYIPHAPAADNLQYKDLPVTFAGLRGVAEVTFYRENLSIGSEQLHIVGNPSANLLEEKIRYDSSEGPNVLALSPLEPQQLQLVFSLLSEVGPFVVAPHPRSDVEIINKLLPSGWRLHLESTTSQLLKTGVRSLIQISSGVAWESTAMGVPTATLRLPEVSLNYPFLEDHSKIPALWTKDDVRHFTQEPAKFGFETARHYAESWCGLDGNKAIHAARQLITTAENSHNKQGLIFDAWKLPDGIALQQSGFDKLL